MKLKDKVVVITGASSGIGKELAIQMSQKGSRVVLAARNANALENLAKQIQKSGGSALSVPTDVSVRSQVDNLIQKTIERFGRLDVMINNAGVSLAQATLMENKEDDIRATMDTNFMGSIYGVWAAVPVMEKTGGGLLVFTSSIIGKRGIPRNAAYCASKFALQGLTESIRPELQGKNIRVITICPPGVDTPFLEKNKKGIKRTCRLHPVEKIARMIVQTCEKEKREALLTMDSKLIYYLNFLFPRVFDRVLAKMKEV